MTPAALLEPAIEAPFVSVILPVRNEECFIERCVRAILEQDYPADRVEVLVADGLSDDRTRELIAGLPGSERVRILDNPERLQAPGLNRCIAEARGEIIVRVDGHTTIAPDYVTRCVEALRTTGAWNVGGAISNTGTTPWGRAIAAAAMSPFGVPGAFHGSSSACFTDTVYMGAWPRKVFANIGGFAPDLAVNEDYELNHRIRTAGGKVWYSPEIRCRYFGRQTLGALAKQYFRYGEGKVKMLARHPGSLKWRHTVAPAFVAALVVGALLASLVPFARLPLALLVASYAAANLLASARVAWKRSLPLLPRIALAFLTMHVTWGAGFWAGCARLPMRHPAAPPPPPRIAE